ncbi:uncharacterized protein LOC116117528 [Pistacia vera]|uniref:uncharacterized protein LOC116117528 n=1 Tax=Pistacia vera TaxID=55513 RepID=UPI001263568E|nr:uncharacterized protein LOC116117528 [Pistacia vera]
MEAGCNNSTTLVTPPTLPMISVKVLDINYSFWISQVLLTLISHGLHGFVIGKREFPSMFIMESNEESGKLTKKGNHSKCSSSYEIWSTLELHFQSISKARTLHLWNLLQTTKKNALSVSEYVLKMKELCDELIASGVSISDEELLLDILDGLGLEHDAIVASLITNSSSMTLQEAHFFLHKHEIRLDRQHNSLNIFLDKLASTLVAFKQNSEDVTSHDSRASSKNLNFSRSSHQQILSQSSLVPVQSQFSGYS